MQRISGEEDNKKILPEAYQKLINIQTSHWRPIAKELDGEDPYRFLRAYSPGLQEYIEALSFHRFLDNGELISIDEVEQTLVFPRKDPEESTDGIEGQPMETDVVTLAATPEHDSKSEPTSTESDQISVHIPPVEYMLGIADLTGEVMRMAIHSVGSGNLDQPARLCTFLRTIHDHFLLFGNTSRELNRKMFTLKQSLQKVEAVCYTLQMRGSEIPKHMLVEMLQTVGDNYTEDPSLDPV